MSDNKRSIILGAGPSCFVRCPGCYNHFADSLQHGNTVTLDGIRQFGEEAFHRGYAKITVGGGDPLSRPDIIEILRSLRELGFKISLDTVGTVFNAPAETIFHGRRLISQVSPLAMMGLVDLVGIPLDGSNQDIAQIFRTGRPTLFEEQMKTIKSLGAAGLSVCVNTVASACNVHDLPKLLECLMCLPIVKWQIFQFMPIGPLGAKHVEQFFVSKREFESVVDRVLELHKQFGCSFEIQPKSIEDRRGRYLMVDDAGEAWIPTGYRDERVLIGNISLNKGRSVLDTIELLDREVGLVFAPSSVRGKIPSISQEQGLVP